jgi:hypothetical protein
MAPGFSLSAFFKRKLALIAANYKRKKYTGFPAQTQDTAPKTIQS